MRNQILKKLIKNRNYIYRKLCNYNYTNKKAVFRDYIKLEELQKEIEIQKCYQLNEGI